MVSLASAPGGRCTVSQSLIQPSPHELADLVTALRLGRCNDGVSLHLWAILSKAMRVSPMLRIKTATKIAFLPGESRKGYGCVTSTCLAIAS